MSQKRKRRDSVRDRVPSLQKPKEVTDNSGQNGAGTATEEPPVAETKNEPERIPATEADYLAAQFHEARAKNLQFRQTILDLQRALIQKDQIIIQREQTILVLETKSIEAKNEQLRNEHGLELGLTIHKDDETGKVYFLKKDEEQK